jgi:hypothetical protein
MVKVGDGNRKSIVCEGARRYLVLNNGQSVRQNVECALLSHNEGLFTWDPQLHAPCLASVDALVAAYFDDLGAKPLYPWDDTCAAATSIAG